MVQDVLAGDWRGAKIKGCGRRKGQAKIEVEGKEWEI